MYLSKIGFKENFLILSSLLNSKFLNKNINTSPKLKFIKINFLFLDHFEFNKSKLLIIILDFLDKLTGVRSIIKNAKIFSKKDTFYKCQVILSRTQYFFFLDFLNNFILTKAVLKFITKPLKLIQTNKTINNLFLFDISSLFDIYVRQLLPKSKSLWLEIEFHYSNNHKLLYNINLKTYSQLFFCHNILE